MRDDINVHLYYKNFRNLGQCHIGLGVGASHASKILHEHGIHSHVYGILKLSDIIDILDKPTRPVTHVIIEAPWLSDIEVQTLMDKYPETHFIVRYHSQVAFLQVDPSAVRLIRSYLNLQELNNNFQIAANHPRLGHFIQQVYNSHVLLLPNLYPIKRINPKIWRIPTGRVIRLGSFGALRLQKNHITAAAAALILARTHNLEMEFHVNSNRDVQTGILGVLRDLFANVPHCSLVEIPWAPWPEFRHRFTGLDIHLQMSTTESFNFCTADSVAEGTPCVVSDAIDWVPKDWVAPIDDAYTISHVAHRLLYDPLASDRGCAALKKYVDKSIKIWLSHLIDGNRETMPIHLEQNI